MAFEVDKKVEAIKVATIRLLKVAIDIALARMLVGKISDGMSQATGPIPILKRDRYSASPMMTNTELLFPMNEKLIKMQAPHMPGLHAVVVVSLFTEKINLYSHYFCQDRNTN